MDRSLKWRVGLVLAVLVVSIYFVYPTLKLAWMPKATQEAMDPAKLAKLKDKAIRYGLDLQGGMHLVLEVDKTGIEDADSKDLMTRAEAIIRNRIDKFGVSEPTIQTQGRDRIIVQLAGLTDEQRAKDLVGQTALLEFKIVKEGDDLRRVLSNLDEALRADIETITGTSGTEQLEAEITEAAAETDTAGLRAELQAEAAKGTTLSSLVSFVRVGPHEDAMVDVKDVDAVQRILKIAEERRAIPQDLQILWDKEVEDTREGKFQRIYLLTRKPALTGKYISTAKVTWGNDPSYPNAAGVSMDFNRIGKSLFSKVTGENVDRRMAIVLDDNVHSAPNIKEKIRAGTGASISGSFTTEQAKDLATVLEAGALPAPLKIIEERTVGPSLGSDSIRSGIRASLIGGIVTLIFMVAFYYLSGLIADLAIFLNLLILLAAMSALKGTLTLPGIAGVILSLAMAVDANVLIFERIKEEMRAGKTIRKAINDGYARAFITILDSNVTTLITAAVLFQFGTGPIKGFAVTLTVGIIASMFTAIVVTRVIFDLMTGTRQMTKLSI